VALIAALKQGVIRAAGLDVFENEPSLNPGFLELDNVVLMPHIGSSTRSDAPRHGNDRREEPGRRPDRRRSTQPCLNPGDAPPAHEVMPWWCQKTYIYHLVMVQFRSRGEFRCCMCDRGALAAPGSAFVSKFP